MAAIDLIVLGMIKDSPKSAYELQKNIEYRNISRWVKVSTPSIYKKVVQLEERGYISGTVKKEGRMPEKTVYEITEKGNGYFLSLMQEISRKTVSVYLDFNAVIMNLNLVSDSEKKELLQNIEREIRQFEELLEGKLRERTHVPLTGRTIVDQQLRLAQTQAEWISDFRNEYLTEDAEIAK